MGLLDYTSFLRESILNEAKDITKVQKPFFDAYAKLFPQETSPKNTKTLEIIRARFGLNTADAEKNIRSLFSEVKIPVDSVNVHLPGTIRDGNRLASDDYFTYEIKSGIETYWVTNLSKDAKGGAGGVQEIGKKDLTPAALNLNGVYIDSASLAKAVNDAIAPLSWLKPATQKILLGLVNSTLTIKPSFNNMKEFFMSREHSDTVTISEKIEDLDLGSIQNVINDFGEVLDGIYILASVKEIKKGLFFPHESNKPLLDIECDGYMISSKDAKSGGGSPSAAPIIAALDDPSLVFDENEKTLASILSPIKGKGTYDQYMMLADIFLAKKDLTADSAFQHLLTKMGIASHPEQNALEKYLEDLSIEEYTELVEVMGKKSGKNAKTSAADVKKRLGLVFVQITKECGDTLNNKYQEAFSSITTKVLSLKQIYLAIQIKQNKITFTSKASEIMKAKFDASGPTPATPFNAGLSFKFMKGR